MAPKRVCVIGAGVSGLVTIKEFKQAGMETVCYELNSDVGGLWTDDRDTQTSNAPRAWDNLITNASKFVMTYSDYNIEPDNPVLMTRRDVARYFNSYADHFKLRQHIRFNTRVLKVRKAQNYDKTGQWEVLTCPTEEFHDGDRRSALPTSPADLRRCKKNLFDYVMVCSGPLKVPKYPDIPGLDEFPGLVTHSFDYKSPEPFRGMKVLVVGNACSAGDISSDISGHTDKPVELSIGSGTWIIPRVYGGTSRDRGDTWTREALYSASEVAVNERIIAKCQNRLDHLGSGINPPLPPSRAPFIVGDDIYLKIFTNQVRIQGNLVRFVGSQAEFQDGTRTGDLDAVVMATGYSRDTSFVKLDIVGKGGKMELYNMMLPIREKHHTLAFIGFLGGLGPQAPRSELQARYMVRLLTKKIDPPSMKAMEARIERQANLAFPADVLASDLGVFPSPWRIFLRDPVLAYRVWYGPMFAAQYRLLGPDNDWESARATCYRAYEVHSGKSLVQIKRDDVRAAMKKFMLKLSCGAAAACAFAGYAYSALDWRVGQIFT